MKSKDIETEGLKEETNNPIQKARMVLPGIQALFGFQTMAVFNSRFNELSSHGVLVYRINPS